MNDYILESKDKSQILTNFKKKSNLDYKVYDISSREGLKYLNQDPKWMSPDGLSYLKKYTGEIIVNNNKIIGYILIKDRSISTIRIDEEYRGYGLSNILMIDAINKYKGNKLGVYKDNQIALRLYEKHGFKIIDTRKDKGGEWYYMELDKKINESFDIVSFYNELKEELERNEDGFYMITPSSNKEELDDAYQKFNCQNDEQKKKADIRSAALYGMNNYDHYHILLSKIKKGTKDDELNGFEYNPHDGEVVKEEGSIYYFSHTKDGLEFEHNIERAKEFNKTTSDRVIIYPTKDANELESLYMKYMALGTNSRAASDNKAHEMFGSTNREIYKYIKDNVIKPQNDEIESTHSVEDKKIEKEDKKDSSLFSNDLPLLTPEQMSERVEEDYSCFNIEDGKVIKAWREAYSLLGYGIKTLEYNDYNRKRLDILRKSIYENNTEAIIQCGWIPGIEFSLENRAKASKYTVDDILNSYPKLVNWVVNTDETIEDIENRSRSVEESSINKDKKAVSIILIQGNSFIGKTIRAVQRNEFSHASISLDDDLDRIYSYNSRNGFNGLAYESMSQYVKEGVEKIGVYTFLVSDTVYKALEDMVNNLSLYINKTRYSILNLFTIPLNIPLDMDMKMVCSEFVDKLLKSANVDLTGKKSSLVSPKDFTKAVKNKVNIVEVFNGHPKDFNKKKVSDRIKKLKRSKIGVYEFTDYTQPVNEIKEFPVQFDNDGNLFIKNLKNINFDNEYNASHRFLMIYDKNGNIEGMKYELAKLFSLNIMLENRIYNSRFRKKDSEKYKVIRARVLNDFNKYLDIVVRKDNKFNFAEYYDNSPFSDAVIRINNPTIKFSIDTFKYALK